MTTEETRLHESAHAVVATLVGIPVYGLSARGPTGRCTFRPPRPVASHSELRSYIATYLAGQLADEIVTGDYGLARRPSASHDREAARDAAQRVDRTRWAWVLDEERIRAGRLVRTNWPAITTLAASLASNGDELGDLRVDKAIAAALAGKVWTPPPPVAWAPPAAPAGARAAEFVFDYPALLARLAARRHGLMRR